MGDSVITDPIQILDEGHNFYRNLYSENAGHDPTRMSEIGTTFTNAGSLLTIDVVQQDQCEQCEPDDRRRPTEEFKSF